MTSLASSPCPGWTKLNLVPRRTPARKGVWAGPGDGACLDKASCDVCAYASTPVHVCAHKDIDQREARLEQTVLLRRQIICGDGKEFFLQVVSA